MKSSVVIIKKITPSPDNKKQMVIEIEGDDSPYLVVKRDCNVGDSVVLFKNLGYIQPYKGAVVIDFGQKRGY